MKFPPNLFLRKFKEPDDYYFCRSHPECSISTLRYQLFVKYAYDPYFLEDSYQKLVTAVKEKFDVNVYELERCNMTCSDSNGSFHYYDGYTLSEMKQYSYNKIQRYGITSDLLVRSIDVPRIEMLRERDSIALKICTLAHEVGHLLCYMRNEENTEEAADLYVKEVIETLLGPFYTGMLTLPISLYTKSEPYDDIELFYIEHFAFSPLRKKYSFELI